MEKTVKQRLMEFAEFRNLSISKFESLCGLGNGYVGKLKGEPGSRKLEDILKAFPELNRVWLLFGEGEMLKSTNTGDITITGNGNSNIGHGHYNVPARVTGCGRSCENCCDRAEKCPDCGRKTGEVIWVNEVRKPVIPTEWAYRPNIDIFKEVMMNLDKVSRSMFIVLDCPIDMWLVVRDDSLAPRAYRGDSLGLSQYPPGMEDPIWGKFHAIGTVSNGLVVRKLYPADGGYRCVSPNEDYPDLYIKFDNILSISRVVYVVRKAL